MTSSAPAPFPVPFRLITLGETLLLREIDGQPVEELLRGGKVIALLIYLACQEGRSVAREELADLLWGDESPDNARASLRQALYALRRLLGEGILRADRQQVALAPSAIMVDRDAFVAGARGGDLAQMLASYHGPFCARLEVGSARRFLDWMEEERQRLRQLLLDQGQRALPALVQGGASAPALALARQLQALEPEDAGILAVFVDVLIAGGAIEEARERVTSAVTTRRAAGDPIPDALQARSQRLARQDPSAPVRRGTLDALGHQMLGRESVTQQLLVEAERARLGEPRRLLLSGPVGIGKTRVLDEVEARLRLRGARVVRLRLLPAMREVPYAALADVMRGLVQLPGSLGIAEGAARELVTLLPEFAARFPSALPHEAKGEDRRRFQREALGDLLTAVADERLVVLMIDEIAEADEVSRQVVAGVRCGAGTHLLEIFTARPGMDVDALAADRGLVLSPFGVDEVRGLLEGVAPLPDAPWVDHLLTRLVERSRGIPQAILQLIRTTAAGGQLVPTAEGWVSEAPDELMTVLASGAWLEEGIEDLAPLARRLMTVLDQWQVPIDERDLIAVIRTMQEHVTEPEVGAALRQLETRGLVTSRDTTWTTAFRSVSDLLEARAVPGESRVTLERLTRYWCDPVRLDIERMEHLARLIGAASERALLGWVARAAARAPRIRAAELRGRRLARRLAAAAGRPDWEDEALAAIGFLARQDDRGLAAIGAATAVVVGLVIWLVAMFQPRLRFEVDPMADAPHPELVDLAVQPRVVLEDGFGRRYRFPLPVRMQAMGAMVFGDSLRILRDGRAQFERIGLRPTAPRMADRDVELRATGPWYVRGTSARIRGSRLIPSDLLFRVREVQVDGVSLGDSLIAHVTGEDSLRVRLTFAYSTEYATANYVVGALPVWGARDREVIRLTGLPSPVVDAWRTVAFTVPPPPGPGTYHIVLAAAADDGVDFLFSLTNWTVGRPRWYDGNDISDLGPAKFEELRRTGAVEVRVLHARHSVRLGTPWFPTRGTPPQAALFEEEHFLPGTAIRVVVSPRSDRRAP